MIQGYRAEHPGSTEFRPLVGAHDLAIRIDQAAVTQLGIANDGTTVLNRTQLSHTQQQRRQTTRSVGYLAARDDKKVYLSAR